MRQPDALVGPKVAMMYTTHIVQDIATDVTYLDTVTTSIGRVALGNPHMVANLWGPIIEEEGWVATLEQSNYGSFCHLNLKLC